MLNRSRIVPLAALLLLACDRPPLGPVPEAGPLYDWMNNPDNGNVRIVRFEEEFAISWSDAANGLRATHATVPLGDLDCGPQDVLDPISNQLTGNIDPDEFFDSWFRMNSQGTVWITVRDLNQPGNCFGALLVAEGWGEISNTDNDIFGLTPGQHNANVWGSMAHGKLTTPDGESVEYAGHFRARVNFAAGGTLLSAQVTVR